MLEQQTKSPRRPLLSQTLNIWSMKNTNTQSRAARAEPPSSELQPAWETLKIKQIQAPESFGDVYLPGSY